MYDTKTDFLLNTQKLWVKMSHTLILVKSMAKQDRDSHFKNNVHLLPFIVRTKQRP